MYDDTIIVVSGKRDELIMAAMSIATDWFDENDLNLNNRKFINMKFTTNKR